MATHSSTLAWKIPRTEEAGSYSLWSRKESVTTEQLHFLGDARRILLFMVEEVFLPMREVWSMYNADIQCSMGREGAKMQRRMLMLKFSLSCHKIWILFHKIPSLWFYLCWLLQHDANRHPRMKGCLWDLSYCSAIVMELAWVPASVLRHVWLFVALWTVACQASLSVGFSRQE